jgi:hypothetical protein
MHNSSSRIEEDEKGQQGRVPFAAIRNALSHTIVMHVHFALQRLSAANHIHYA